MPRLVAIVTAVAVSIGAAACGGDDDEPSPVSAAFLRQGEALCTDLGRRLDLVFARFVATGAGRVDAYRQAIPLGEEFLAAFRGLRVPPADRTRMRLVANSYDDALDRLRAGVAAAADGDLPASNRRFTAGFATMARADANLRDYGFRTCGRSKAARGNDRLSAAEVQRLADARREYIRQADTICAAGERNLDPLEEATFSGGIPSLEQWHQFLAAALPIFEGVVRDVGGLPVPPGDEVTIGAMLDHYRQALARGRDAEAAARGGDARGFETHLAALADAAGQGDDVSEQYGFQVCHER